MTSLEDYYSEQDAVAKDASAMVRQEKIMTQFSANPILVDVYHYFCRELKCKADPSVSRLLEKKIPAELIALDISSTYLSGGLGFTALMDVCRTAPHLVSLNLANTNLRRDCVVELRGMVEDHPALRELDVSNNSALGFDAAKQLVPMLKTNRRIINLNVTGTAMAKATQDLIEKVLNQNRELEAEARRTQSEGADGGDGEQPSISTPPDAQANLPESTLAALQAAEDVARSPKADAPDPDLMDVSGQKAVNVRLMRELMDHEERITLIHAGYLEKCGIRQNELSNRHNQGSQLLSSYEQGWKWPLASDFTIASIIKEFDLNLSERELDEMHQHYSPAGKVQRVNIDDQLAELSQSDTSNRRRHHLIEVIGTAVEGHGPGMASMVNLLSSFYDLLHMDGTSLASIKEMLEETGDQIEDLKIKAERAAANRIRALNDEDMELAATYFEEFLEQQERWIDIILYRLNQLLNKASRTHLMENLNKLCERSDDEMNATKQLNDDLMQRLEEDLGTTKKRLQAEHETMQYREGEFEETRKRNREEIKANQRQQDKIWRDITYSYKELQELGDHRLKEISDFTKEMEKHERQKVEYNAIVKLCGEHTKTLQQLLNDCQVCDGILQSFDDYIRTSATKGTTLGDSVSSEGDGLALAEQQNYLALFREYYMSIGELIFKKDKRLEELARQMRSLEFQIENCKETFDPDLQRYRILFRELESRSSVLEEQCAGLRRRADDRAEEFKPHEEALRAAGIDFDSPLLEMSEDIVDRRAKALEQRQKFLDRDKHEFLDKEAEGIQQMANTTKQARATGISSLIHPLSPAGSAGAPGGPSRSPTPTQPVAFKRKSLVAVD